MTTSSAKSREKRQKEFLPERVFVAEDSLDDALCQRVMSRLPEVPVEILKSAGDPITENEQTQALLREAALSTDAQRYSQGKRWLYLTRYRGRWLKRCPGTLAHVCCNLFVVNPAQGCPIDCTYCCLQTYLRRNPTLTVFTNIEEMIAEIKQSVLAEKDRFFRVCTGELTDSLVLDDLTDLSLELVPFFAGLDNALLELKTKDSFVENLLSLGNSHNKRTVVSWSLNAPSVVKNDEALSASLDERLQAAGLAAEAGYRIGLHFDPLVPIPGWQDEYSQTIKHAFSVIKPSSIAWISIAPLRYHPQQQRLMMERFPGSRLPFGEQFLAKDNKLRIIQPLRFKMIRFVWNELKSISPELPVYMCMESAAAWRAIRGGAPSSCEELREVYARKIDGTCSVQCSADSMK